MARVAFGRTIPNRSMWVIAGAVAVGIVLYVMAALYGGAPDGIAWPEVLASETGVAVILFAGAIIAGFVAVALMDRWGRVWES